MPLLSFKFFRSSSSSKNKDDDASHLSPTNSLRSSSSQPSSRSARVGSISSNASLPRSLKGRSSNDNYAPLSLSETPNLSPPSTQSSSSYVVENNNESASLLSNPVANSSDVTNDTKPGGASTSALAIPRVSFSTSTKQVSSSGNNGSYSYSDQLTPTNSYGSYSLKSLTPVTSNQLRPTSSIASNTELSVLSSSPSSSSLLSLGVPKEGHNYQRRVSFNTTPQEMDKVSLSTPTNSMFSNNYDIASAVHNSDDSDNDYNTANTTTSSGGGRFMSNIMKKSDALFTSSGSKARKKERSNSVYSLSRSDGASLTRSLTNNSILSNSSTSRALVNKSFSISSRHEAFTISRYSRTMIVALNGYLDLKGFYNKNLPHFNYSLDSIISTNLVREYLWNDVGFVWAIAALIEDGDELVIMKQFNTKKLKREIKALTEPTEINCNSLLEILGERILESAVLLARKYARKLTITVELASTDIYNKKGTNPGNGGVNNNGSDTNGLSGSGLGPNNKKYIGHKYFWQEVFQLYMPTIIIIGRNNTTSAASVTSGGGGDAAKTIVTDDLGTKFKFKLNPLSSSKNSKSREGQLIDSLIRKCDLPIIMVFKNMLASILDLRNTNYTGPNQPAVGRRKQSMDRRNSYSVIVPSRGNDNGDIGNSPASTLAPEAPDISFNDLVNEAADGKECSANSPISSHDSDIGIGPGTKNAEITLPTIEFVEA
ncbi:hypothetical protein NADFUDRAFT_83745 [Nadsonia fulvescens var. elongata DSM 6958]|uniref:Uncharacterized protein n=1 Tax=Nadsonia fulvescens var. elongata DSM 6958 TaxID=857566 RepID=A0A1E3PFN4_9ASCO|nr:hypothetical protein NADFUDRAFT_83745 [Nadsonia fulvescens var. elongata DSM 6958]